MRTIIFISFIIMTIACRQKQVKKAPTVLEEKKVDVSSIYKKRSGDLVEALYDELVSQSAELTQLELDIKELQKQSPDSLKDFKQYNEKNNAYYDLAGKKINTVTDSVLKKKLLAMIKHSQRQYMDSIAQLRGLDSLITKRIHTLNDLHTLLKLVKTLPLIEEFQRSNRPPATPAGNALNNLDSLAQRVDSLINADSLANLPFRAPK